VGRRKLLLRFPPLDASASSTRRLWLLGRWCIWRHSLPYPTLASCRAFCRRDVPCRAAPVNSCQFFEPRMHQNVWFCIINIYFFGVSRPPTTLTLLPSKAGAPPLLSGWLRPCIRLPVTSDGYFRNDVPWSQGSTFPTGVCITYWPSHKLQNLTVKAALALALGTPQSRYVQHVTIDQYLTFDDHITKVVSFCNYHIRSLRLIGHLIDRVTENTIACSIVITRLNCCNAIIIWHHWQNILRLQRVKNSLARVVCAASFCSPSAPLLRSLHWLPIRHRITHKVATLIFKELHHHQPTYLYTSCWTFILQLVSYGRQVLVYWWSRRHRTKPQIVHLLSQQQHGIGFHRKSKQLYFHPTIFPCSKLDSSVHSLALYLPRTSQRR